MVANGHQQWGTVWSVREKLPTPTTRGCCLFFVRNLCTAAEWKRQLKSCFEHRNALIVAQSGRENNTTTHTNYGPGPGHCVTFSQWHYNHNHQCIDWMVLSPACMAWTSQLYRIFVMRPTHIKHSEANQSERGGRERERETHKHRVNIKA